MSMMEEWNERPQEVLPRLEAEAREARRRRRCGPRRARSDERVLPVSRKID